MARQRPWFRTRNPISVYWTSPHSPTFLRPYGKASMTLTTDGPAQLAKSFLRYGANMAYAVELTLRAERDLDDLYESLSAEHSTVVRRWFNGLEKAIYTLERFPRRCPRAPEAGRTNRSLRHLLY